MRIVYLLASLGVGGAEKQTLAVAERMAKRGHTVAVLVLMPRLPEEWPTAIRTVHLDVRKTTDQRAQGLHARAQFSAASFSFRHRPQPQLSRQHLCPFAPRGLPAICRTAVRRALHRAQRV